MPATSKLYPPVLAGTLPSMVRSKGPLLRVPFSMNRAVAASKVTGLRMRLKTTNTDTILCQMDLTAESVTPNIYPILASSSADDQLLAVFNLGEYQNRFSIGMSYKVQIAYIDTSKVCGYFSTVAIVKCTDDMTVTIQGLDAYGNNFDFQEFTGQYLNDDTTEVVYQYRFDLFDSAYNILETTDWQPHTHYGDPENGQSQDTWRLNKVLINDQVYFLRYTIQTNSYTEVSSPYYTIVAGTGLPSDVAAPLHAVLDYNNAVIKVNYNAIFEMNSGRYEFSRASSKDNFGSWTRLFTFQLNEKITTGQVFYTDYMIEHGVTYRYSVRQYNSRGLYSRRTITNDVIAYFEDLFLWDGERQLCIRFNPKINQFKRVLSESKKNTIGYKYPKFFRNGVVDYKEFQISGLLSYLMDNDGYFYSREELGYADHENETDITDENLALERRFNMAALQWLSDGKPKLLKSPGEGNYIVRLMNTSLTANDSVSRMLHTFTTTASECGDADNLNDFINLGLYAEPTTLDANAVTAATTLSYYSVPLHDIIDKQDTSKLKAHDGIGSIKIENCVPGTVFHFKVVDKDGLLATTRSITIGATGYYYLELTDGSLIKEISIDRPVNRTTIYDSVYNGTITIGAIIKSDFNAVNYCNNVTELCLQRMGLGPQINLLDCLLPISKMYRIKFTKLNSAPIDIGLGQFADQTILAYNSGKYWHATDIYPYFLIDTSSNPQIATTQIAPEYLGIMDESKSYNSVRQILKSFYYTYTSAAQLDYTAKLKFSDDSEIQINLDSLTGTQVFTNLTSIPTAIYAGIGVIVEISCETQEVIYKTGTDNTEYLFELYNTAKENLQHFIATKHTGALTEDEQAVYRQQYNDLVVRYNTAVYNYSKAIKTLWSEITETLSDVFVYDIEEQQSQAEQVMSQNNIDYSLGEVYADSGKKPRRRTERVK